MTTYGVTDQGFILKPLSVIRAEVDEYLKTEIDPGLELSDDGSLGSANAALCNQHALLWELGAAVYSSYWRDSASGFSLIQVGALTGTLPSIWSKTRVLGKVTLNPNKSLSAGAVAHLYQKPNSRFVSLTDVPATATGGVFEVWFEAEEEGAISVAPGQLDTIAEASSGWTAVTNDAAGVTGTQPETEDELREKQESELSATGSTRTDAIKAEIISTGATDAVVTENDTNEAFPSLPPKSVRAVVRGGVAATIAKAIHESKGGGIGTGGEQSENVEDSQGFSHVIRYDVADELNFYANVDIDWLDGYGTTADALAVASALAAYVNTLGIGQNVSFTQCSCAISSVTGVNDINTLEIGLVDPPVETSSLSVDYDKYVTSDVANIDVNEAP